MAQTIQRGEGMNKEIKRLVEEKALEYAMKESTELCKIWDGADSAAFKAGASFGYSLAVDECLKIINDAYQDYVDRNINTSAIRRFREVENKLQQFKEAGDELP